MLPLEHPDRIQIAFDDHRLVNNAGLLLPATLAQRVGLRELVDRHLDLGDAPGRANTGDKIMTLAPPRWLAATASTTPMRCVPVGRPVFSTAWSRLHPPWAPSCGASGGVPRHSTRPRELPVAGPGLTATLNSDGSITLTWSVSDDGSVTGFSVLLRRPKASEETLIGYGSDMGNNRDHLQGHRDRPGYLVRVPRQGQERSRPE